MENTRISLHSAVVAALLVTTAGAAAADDVASLQMRLAQMEQQMAAMKAELARLSAAEPAQTQQEQAIETRVAKVEQVKPTAAEAPKVAGNRVFFRGGYAGLQDDRANGAFVDMNNTPLALGIGNVQNKQDDGWYFGAGFDFLLSRDTLGLLPGTWALAELGLEFRNLGAETTHFVGPVAECLLVDAVKQQLKVPSAGPLNCTAVRGQENLMMLTVSAAPKLKFNEGGKLRPWLIPAGLDLNVVSPPSDSTNYLDIGVQFAGGLDYEILPNITLGADVRYHLSADLTSPDYSAAALAAAKAAGLSVQQHLNNDAFTAGVSLGIGF